MPRTGTDRALYEQRRTNLRLLVAQYDGPTAFARRLDYNGPSYVSQMLSGHREIHEGTARKIERALGLPERWLDAARGAVAPAPVPVDDDALTATSAALLTILQQQQLVLSDEKLLRVYEMAYRDALAKGQVDEDYLRDLLRLAT